MTNKDHPDDDAVPPSASENEPRITTRTSLGRNFLDDDLLLMRSEQRLKSRTYTPIGRDFLSADLPLPRSEVSARSPVHGESEAEDDSSTSDLGLRRDISVPERRPVERSHQYGPDAEAAVAAPRALERVSERVPQPEHSVGSADSDAALAAPTSSRVAPAARVRRAPLPPPETGQSDAREREVRSRKEMLAAIGTVVVLCMIGVGGWLWYEKGGFGAKPTAPVGEPIKNAFYEQTQLAGAQTCSRVFPALGQMATLGSTYSLQASWNQTAPGAHSILAVTGLAYDRADYKGSGAALVFSSPVGTRCEGAAMRVLTLPMACSEVAASHLPAGVSRSDDMAGVPLYELANGAGKLMLLPATASACSVITVMLAED